MSRIVNAEKKKNLCARLARIEGQLRGLQKLIEADADVTLRNQQDLSARDFARAADRQDLVELINRALRVKLGPASW